MAIANNAVLTSVAALSNLTHVGGDLRISGNAALTNLGGVE